MPVPIVDDSKKNEDGTPYVRWVYMNSSDVEAMKHEQATVEQFLSRREELAQQPIVQRDLHRLDVSSPARPHPNVEVPGMRWITDPVELNLIGEGLPVIHGVSYRVKPLCMCYHAMCAAWHEACMPQPRRSCST